MGLKTKRLTYLWCQPHQFSVGPGWRTQRKRGNPCTRWWSRTERYCWVAPLREGFCSDPARRPPGQPGRGTQGGLRVRAGPAGSRRRVDKDGLLRRREPSAAAAEDVDTASLQESRVLTSLTDTGHHHGVRGRRQTRYSALDVRRDLSRATDWLRGLGCVRITPTPTTTPTPTPTTFPPTRASCRLIMDLLISLLDC